jgi:hypothetical protein
VILDDATREDLLRPTGGGGIDADGYGGAHMGNRKEIEDYHLPKNRTAPGRNEYSQRGLQRLCRSRDSPARKCLSCESVLPWNGTF